MELAMKNRILLTAILSFIFSLPVYARDELTNKDLELKINTRYFNDEGRIHASTMNPDPQQKYYEQGALGIELNYISSYWRNVIGFDASLYGVTRLMDSGNNTTVQLLDVNSDGKLDQNFATLGILTLKLKPSADAEIKIGRQVVNTTLVKTTNNRAIPDTFSGISTIWKPLPELRTYLGYYNQWRPRTSAKFTDFVTDANEKIDYIALIGADYNWHGITMNTELLNSKNYLKKYGVQVHYPIKTELGEINLHSGAYFSKDAGNLFKCGAEYDVDCVKGVETDNNGRGYFFQSTWKYKDIELGAAISKFDGMWIEDNYSTQALNKKTLIQDNGTSPFPTSTPIGPDFTNNDELAWMMRIKYDWKNLISGLKTEFKYISGDGAHQSNMNQNIAGKERFSEISLSYSTPWLKNMDLKYAYLTYHSSFDRENTDQKINGLLRDDWHQHRVVLTYSYLF
ncbi:OprD family outer membrane porin [Acinetobacter bereziniae]|uniref:OprD family outer membrane porin n=1 Tax=Acinetobacter bereziniae TaxID=106648 RepID=UPI002259F1F0|nr:OprD family outer membrane porin [Acinetobacter bereziniae]